MVIRPQILVGSVLGIVFTNFSWVGIQNLDTGLDYEQDNGLGCGLDYALDSVAPFLWTGLALFPGFPCYKLWRAWEQC